jgi:hypothetical protein
MALFLLVIFRLDVPRLAQGLNGGLSNERNARTQSTRESHESEKPHPCAPCALLVRSLIRLPIFGWRVPANDQPKREI